MHSAARAPDRAPLVLLALMAGCAMASTTLLQAALPELQKAFHRIDTAAFVVGATLSGYMVGLMVFVPLSDGRDIRSLIARQSLGLTIALGIQAAAPSLPLLVAASFASGALATVSAHSMALAVRLSPQRRGLAVGVIVTGISLGMLLSRAVGGFLTERWGWRTAPAAIAALILLLSLAVRLRAPRSVGTGEAIGPLRGVLRLLPTLATTPGLGRSAMIGGCWFAAFSAFWSALAIHLEAAPFGLGAQAAGAFGFLGVAGALAAQAGGRAVDRFGGRRIIRSGLVVAFAGFALLGCFPAALASMIAGTVLVDMGCFVAQAANQVRVLGLDAERQGQVYGAYMTVYYGAGALGGAAGPSILQGANWQSLCAVAAFLIVLAFAATPPQQATTERP